MIGNRSKQALSAGAEDRAAQVSAETALAGLGLVATQEAAQHILEDVLKSGLIAADPRLSILRLNAALKETM